MEIGVVSDTHGRIDVWRKIEDIFTGVDMIIHAGDILYHPPRLGWTEGYDIPAMTEALNESPTPLVIAKGNCDAEVYEELLNMPVQSPYAFVEAGSLRIVVNHGHLLARDQMVTLGKRYNADIFVFGHTHVPLLEKADSLILLNPGSPSIPKFEINGQPTGTIAHVTESIIRIISIEYKETVFELSF